MKCPDPPHGKACRLAGAFTPPAGEPHQLAPAGPHVQGYQQIELADSKGILRIRLQPASRLQELPTVPDWDSLEVEADGPPPAGIPEPPVGPFFLRLPGVHAGIDDDIGVVQLWLEWAVASGARRILCPAPESDDKAYRYRWLTLVCSLCKEYGLEFAVLEHADTPSAWLLNRFLATRKVCCRQP